MNLEKMWDSLTEAQRVQVTAQAVRDIATERLTGSIETTMKAIIEKTAAAQIERMLADGWYPEGYNRAKITLQQMLVEALQDETRAAVRRTIENFEIRVKVDALDATAKLLPRVDY